MVEIMYFWLKTSDMNKKQIMLAFFLGFAVYFVLAFLFANHDNSPDTAGNLKTALIQATAFSAVMIIFRLIGEKWNKKNL